MGERVLQLSDIRRQFVDSMDLLERAGALTHNQHKALLKVKQIIPN